MKAKRVYQPEPRVEINFDSFKRSLREGIHTFFTPARAIIIVVAWGWRHIAAAMRGRSPSSARAGKEPGLDSPR